MADKAEITVLKLRGEKYTELLGDDFFSGEGCNAWREKIIIVKKDARYVLRVVPVHGCRNAEIVERKKWTQD